jgi:hypothetical protein
MEFSGRNPISSGLAIDSFRKMGFNVSSAICEIIDNSLEANSTSIEIIVKYLPKTTLQKYRRIEKFVFVDNGEGMKNDTLYDCLVLGEGTKRDLKNGIGKFGVGATLAGISQARNIEIYSKTKSGKWLYTKLDLDLLNQGIGIPEPKENQPPAEYTENLDNQGTIVIWDNIDSGESQKDMENAVHEIGRIYRKFISMKKIEEGEIIDNTAPVSITLNGEKIAPYDPLYVTYSPKADDTELSEIKNSETFNFKPAKGGMRITISHLPESWWDDPKKMYKPGNAPVNKIDRKMTSDNMGISIVREGREMMFGEIPYLKLLSEKSKEDGGAPFAPEDRFIGIEISFNRDSDHLFGIEANKSKMFLPRQTRDMIGKILYPIMMQRREHFKKIRGEKEKGKTNPKKPSTKSKQVIQNNIPSPHYTDKEREKLQKFAETLSSSKVEIDEFYSDLVSGYLPMHSWDLDAAGPFVKYEHQLKSIIVKYNMNHPFMKKFFETLEDIAERKGVARDDALSVEEIQRTKTLVDLMLASYGIAEISFENTSQKDEVGNTLTTLKNTWSNISHRISKKDIRTE